MTAPSPSRTVTADPLDVVRGWLANPEWPTFGPGIGHGPLDPGRMAARAAAQQVLDFLEEALAALPVSPTDASSAGLDGLRLTEALNRVLRKHPSLAYAGFVYGETGAEVAREYDALTTRGAVIAGGASAEIATRLRAALATSTEEPRA